MSNDKKQLTEEEKQHKFLQEYDAIIKKYGYCLEAMPVETPTSTIHPKLRLAKYAGQK